MGKMIATSGDWVEQVSDDFPADASQWKVTTQTTYNFSTEASLDLMVKRL